MTNKAFVTKIWSDCVTVIGPSYEKLRSSTCTEQARKASRELPGNAPRGQYRIDVAVQRIKAITEDSAAESYRRREGHGVSLIGRWLLIRNTTWIALNMN